MSGAEDGEWGRGELVSHEVASSQFGCIQGYRIQAGCSFREGEIGRRSASGWHPWSLPNQRTFVALSWESGWRVWGEGRGRRHHTRPVYFWVPLPEAAWQVPIFFSHHSLRVVSGLGPDPSHNTEW